MIYKYILLSALYLSSCTVYEPAIYPTNYQYGCTQYCDDYGCSEVCGYYYTSQGIVYYWDHRVGVWIGPHGYWSGGIYYHGAHPHYYGHGYHGGYHRGHR